MQLLKRQILFALVAGAAFVTPALTATSVQTSLLHMNLEELCQRGDKIFRGTVLDINKGAVTAGGGEIPTVTYRLRVDENFKGSYPQTGDTVIVEIRMVGTLKSSGGDVRRLPVLEDVPQLQMGRDYLLITTPQSAIGLSTTVGLGQGCFSIFSRNKKLLAVNEFNNLGLGLSSVGPVSYSELADAIRALVGR